MIESIFFDPYVWIGFVLIAVFFAVAVFLFRLGRKMKAKARDTFDDNYIYVWGLAWVNIAVAGILAAVHFAVVLVPYDASFYNTYRMTGEIVEIEAAFSGDEGSMSQVFIARVDGIEEYIKSDDQRFRTLEVGDEVNLVCGKIFNYFQEPYYNCSFAS